MGETEARDGVSEQPVNLGSATSPDGVLVDQGAAYSARAPWGPDKNYSTPLGTGSTPTACGRFA